MPELFNLTLI